MTRICPFCGSQVPFDLARPGAETIFCPGCGQELDLPQNPQPESVPADPPPTPDQTPPPPPVQPTFSAPCDGLASLSDQLGRTPAAEPIPWEGSADFLTRLISTIGRVLFHPAQAFRAPATPGHRWAVTFGLILTTLGIAASLLWGYALEDLGFSRLMLLVTIILVPVMVWPSLYIIAGVQHLFLLMVGGAKTGFFSTFRVTCYGQAATLFYLVPVIGSWVTLIWQIVITTVGLSEAHHISRGRAFWAVILPLLLAVIIAMVVAMLVVGSGLSNTHLSGLLSPLLSSIISIS